MNAFDSSVWTDTPVCVIGGTGFLGFQIVRHLHAAGAKVRSISLPASAKHPIYNLSNVVVENADMRDPSAAKKAMHGCRFVFQAAGPVGVGAAARNRIMDEHAHVTKILLQERPSNCRLIHTSSIVAVGATTTAEPLSEDSPFLMQDFPVEYVRGKRAAEEIALAGNNVVVTNPGYLFGPEDFGPSVMGDICRKFWRGRIPITFRGGINCVDVRDVAAGHLLAAEKGESGRRYILGGENISFSQLLNLLSNVANLNPRWVPTPPTWAMTAFAAGAEARSKLFNKSPFPSFEHVRMNRLFWFVTSDRSRSELGFQPRPFVDTLADAFHWMTGRSPIKLRGFNRWWFRPAA